MKSLIHLPEGQPVDAAEIRRIIITPNTRWWKELLGLPADSYDLYLICERDYRLFRVFEGRYSTMDAALAATRGVRTFVDTQTYNSQPNRSV